MLLWIKLSAKGKYNLHLYRERGVRVHPSGILKWILIHLKRFINRKESSKGIDSYRFCAECYIPIQYLVQYFLYFIIFSSSVAFSVRVTLATLVPMSGVFLKEVFFKPPSVAITSLNMQPCRPSASRPRRRPSFKHAPRSSSRPPSALHLPGVPQRRPRRVRPRSYELMCYLCLITSHNVITGFTTQTFRFHFDRCLLASSVDQGGTRTLQRGCFCLFIVCFFAVNVSDCLYCLCTIWSHCATTRGC